MTQHFDPTFYATVAQVIPVLLIVVFIEGRSELRPDALGMGATLFLLATFTLVIGAEMACLRALERQVAPTDWERAVIVAGLLWPAGVLTVRVLGPIAAAIGSGRAGATLLLLYLLGVVVGILLAAADVIAWSTWIVLSSTAPALALCLMSAIDIVPASTRRAVAEWWVSGHRMTTGQVSDTRETERDEGS